MIINGNKIASSILKKIAKEIKSKKLHPKLAIVLIGNDKPSQIYVKKKETAAKKAGIDFKLIKLSKSLSKKEIISEIKKLQKNYKPDGLIVQLPIPDRSWTRDVLNSINPKIDVDCLTQISMKKIKKRKNIIYPPTPSAILEILNNLKVRIKNKKICIIGKGILVGGPLSIILSNLKAHVTVCDSQTKDIKEKCLASDIIICGVGKPNIVTKEMVKNGQIVIDAGTYCKNKKTYGGVDFKNVKKIAKHITPTPGGVGPITVAKLLENTLTLTKKLK